MFAMDAAEEEPPLEALTPPHVLATAPPMDPIPPRDSWLELDEILLLKIKKVSDNE